MNDYPTSSYCRHHHGIVSMHGAAIAWSAYINGFESDLIRDGKRVFDTVYVLRLFGYEPARCKFGITSSGRRGWRLAEHGDTFGALEVLLYERTAYAVEIEKELCERFRPFTVGRARELLAVVPAEDVERTCRDLLALPAGGAGYVRTPLGIFIPEKRIIPSSTNGVAIFGSGYLKGRPLKEVA